MYAAGYVNEEVVDEGRCRFITEFEKYLPLRNISLVEYERRLKKLVRPAMNDTASVRMIIECFKDHWAFKDITVPQSLTRELMFDKLFLTNADEEVPDLSIITELEESKYEDGADGLEKRFVHVPMLMLLGILYCRSNRKQRAEKFYELVEIELTDILKDTDEEFRQYVPMIYEITYKFMFRLYERHRDQKPGENGRDAL